MDRLPLAARDRLSTRLLLIVLLFASAFLLPALGGRFRVLTLHEVFAAEPAREMLSGGHWVIPQFAGKPRTVKPPATGWLIAGSMALFGSEAEWVVRLPAALAGVATAGIVAWLAGRWLGDVGGLVAGLMQATFAYVLMQARLAEADMFMCAAVALAMAAFAAGAVEMAGGADRRELKSHDREGVVEDGGPELASGLEGEVSTKSIPVSPDRKSAKPTLLPPRGSQVPTLLTPPLPHGRSSLNAGRSPDGASPPPPLPLALGFHIGMGLAFLFKGVGIVFVLLGCLAWVLVPAVPALFRRGPWSAVGRRWRPAARLLFHPVGLPLLVAMVVAWPLAAWRQMPDIVAVWRRETVGRATGEFGPPDPWHVYFWSVPYLLLPWLPFAVAGAVALFPRGGKGIFGQAAAAVPPAARQANDAADPTSDRSGGTGAPGQSGAGHDPRVSFLACWFLGGMTLLTLSSFRHKHYAIPMLPPITLLAAAGFTDWLRRVPRTAAGVGGERVEAGTGRAWLPPVAVASVTGAVAVGCLLAFGKQAKVEMATTAALVAVGIAATAGLYFAGRTRAVVVACFGTALVGGLAFQGLILPKFDDYRASADLARRANATVPAGATVYLVALGEAHPAFYVTHPLVRVDRRKDIAGFVRDAATGRDAYALCPASAVPLLAEVGDVTELDRVDHLRRTEKDPTVLVKVRVKPAQTRSSAP